MPVNPEHTAFCLILRQAWASETQLSKAERQRLGEQVEVKVLLLTSVLNGLLLRLDILGSLWTLVFSSENGKNDASCSSVQRRNEDMNKKVPGAVSGHYKCQERNVVRIWIVLIWVFGHASVGVLITYSQNVQALKVSDSICIWLNLKPLKLLVWMPQW
jgi:hypothetical protein